MAKNEKDVEKGQKLAVLKKNGQRTHGIYQLKNFTYK